VSDMSSHQKLKEQIIQKISERRYGSVLVKGVIGKHEGIWKNVVIKILPMYLSDTYTVKEKLDYGNFAMVEDVITVKDLVELIKNLPEKGNMTINLGGYEVQVEGQSLTNGRYKYDSGVDYLDVGWFFETYQCTSRNQSYSSELLVSPDLPLFPDSRVAIQTFLGIDPSRHSGSFGIIFCLPRYGARIEELSIGSRQIRVKVQPKAESIKNIIGKLYCQGRGKIEQKDIEFAHETESATVGFEPDFFHFALVSKVSGEVLDTRRFGTGWQLPKGVVFDVPEYELLELIRRGESETVEFKEKIGKPGKFAETVVAFANGKGGVVLLGVDDHANIIGLSERNHEDMITNILRSHCEPQIKCQLDKRQLDEKNVIVLHVEEGEDKPYTMRDKGVYVRANATDRVATRYELDEFYKERPD
jgi:hypothetical protein